MFFILPWFVVMAIAAVHAFARRKTLDRQGVVDLFLRYQLVLGLGLGGLFGFSGHCFNPEKVAAGIGWPAHPQFQFELAAFELGYAVAALACIWIKERWYWLGVTVAPSIFLLLAGMGHIREMSAHGNVAAYNVLATVPDFLQPATLAVLLAWSFALARKRQPQAAANAQVSPQ